MIITKEDINKYNLSPELLGGNVRWKHVREGGKLVCPDCKENKIIEKPIRNSVSRVKTITIAERLVVLDLNTHIDDGDWTIPTCPKCGAKSILKFATPTGKTFVSMILPDQTEVRTFVSKNPKDKKDMSLFLKISLGRLNRAYANGMSTYFPKTRSQRKKNKEI